MKTTSWKLSTDDIKKLKKIAFEKDKKQVEIIREYLKIGFEKDKDVLNR